MSCPFAGSKASGDGSAAPMTAAASMCPMAGKLQQQQHQAGDTGGRGVWRERPCVTAHVLPSRVPYAHCTPPANHPQRHRQRARWALAARGGPSSPRCTAPCAARCCTTRAWSAPASTPFARPASPALATAPHVAGMWRGSSPTQSCQVRAGCCAHTHTHRAEHASQHAGRQHASCSLHPHTCRPR
jgi:hypothetical protein